MDGGAGSGAGLNEGHAIGLGAHHGGQGTALALAGDDNDAALAGLMFGLAPVYAVLDAIGRVSVSGDGGGWGERDKTPLEEARAIISPPKRGRHGGKGSRR